MSLKGDIIKSAKAMATTKVNSASGKGQPPKRLNSEMSPYASMEEITVISHQLESLTDDVKNIRENSCNHAEKQSRDALLMANYNEQYSRKNNIKIMDVNPTENETIEELTTKVCNLASSHGLTLEPSNIMAIHRIPGRVNSTKPVLVKLKNNHEKTKIMKHRSNFKKNGNRLVDDVTKLNAKLIQTLTERDDIEQAWFFNGSVFAKSRATDKRYNVDLFDDVGQILKS